MVGGARVYLKFVVVINPYRSHVDGKGVLDVPYLNVERWWERRLAFRYKALGHDADDDGPTPSGLIAQRGRLQVGMPT